MNGFELNKIAAAVLLAGVIAMIVGNITDLIYMPHNIDTKVRGYSVPVTEQSGTSSAPAAAPAPVNIGELMANADPSRGQNDIRKCAVCHDFTKGGPNKVGPNLWNVLGGPKAHRKDYTYSQALASKGGTWTYEDIYHFLNGPRTFIPGTKMNFPGFSKPQDVADVIAYLRNQSDSPIPLPPVEK
jgi:cytochrome c